MDDTKEQPSCPFGYYARAKEACPPFYFAAGRDPYGMADYGLFGYNAHAVAHAIASPYLSKSEYRLAFSTRRRLDPGGKQALLLSPHLNKTQAKQLLKDAEFSAYLRKNPASFLRHGLVAEGLRALGLRSLYDFAKIPGLSEETYLKIMDEAGEPGSRGRMEFTAYESYPKHWYILASQDWTPDNIRRELLKRLPAIGGEMLQEIDSLPIDVLFLAPTTAYTRELALQKLEARTDEVQAWLAGEFPELLDLPYEWVMEVLNGKDESAD